MDEERDSMMIKLDKVIDLCKEPGKYIYHYTSMETAINYIIASNKIRLSSLENTNDPEEVERLKSIALNGSKGHGKEDMEMLMYSKHILSKFFLSASFSLDKPYAVPCNTKNYFDIQDHVTRGYLFPRMWALYGDNHKGICLCFNRQKLEEIAKKQFGSDNIFFKKVEYIGGDLNSFYKSRYHNMDNVPLIFSPTIDFLPDMVNHIIEHKDFFFFSKQSDWIEECEYRFIYTKRECTPLFEYLDFGDSLEALILGHRFPIEKGDDVYDLCEANNLGAFKVKIIPGFSCIMPINRSTNKTSHI